MKCLLPLLLVIAAPVFAQTVPVPRPVPEDRLHADPLVPQSDAPAQAVENRPLTEAETAAFSQSVAACWNIGSIDADGRATSVTIEFDMTQDGFPIAETMFLIEASDASAEHVDQAWRVAIRAVMRCAGSDGYALPVEAYPSWRIVQLTFDPAQMSIR